MPCKNSKKKHYLKQIRAFSSLFHGQVGQFCIKSGNSCKTNNAPARKADGGKAAKTDYARGQERPLAPCRQGACTEQAANANGVGTERERSPLRTNGLRARLPTPAGSSLRRARSKHPKYAAGKLSPPSGGTQRKPPCAPPGQGKIRRKHASGKIGRQVPNDTQEGMEIVKPGPRARPMRNARPQGIPCRKCSTLSAGTSRKKHPRPQCV